MGYRVSWVAVKGKSEAKVLDELSLVKTDETTDPFDSGDYECATLSNGWFLVTVNEYDDRIVAMDNTCLRHLAIKSTEMNWYYQLNVIK